MPAAPGDAQPWAGTEAIAIEVQIEGGQPLAGATIEAVFFSDDGRGGPDLVSTDANGRAALYGLVEGRWVVRVRHPSVLTYEGDVELRAGRKPRELRASQIREGSAESSARIRYSRPSGAQPTRARQRATREQQRAAAEPAGSRSSEPSEDRSRRERRRRPQPAVEPAEPAPQPQSRAQPEPERPTPSRRERAAARPADRRAEPESPRPARPDYLRSPADGTCFDCRPGEWAVTARLTEPTSGSGQCPPADDAATAAAARFEAAPDGVAPWTGPLAGAGAPADQLPELDRQAWSGSECTLLMLKLPSRSQFKGFLFEVEEGRKRQPCLPDQPCGQGQFEGPPLVHPSESGAIVVGRHRGNAQGARMTVYFVPPSDWRPQSRPLP